MPFGFPREPSELRGKEMEKLNEKEKELQKKEQTEAWGGSSVDKALVHNLEDLSSFPGNHMKSCWPTSLVHTLSFRIMRDPI